MTNSLRTTTHKSSAHTLPETYTVGGQKRVLFTVDTGEALKLMDVPASLLGIAAAGHETPDSYVVEDGLPQRDAAGEMDALLEDYLSVAKRHRAIPMTVFAMKSGLLH